MSDSSDDEITKESHDYPACEEDDCYCKRHWPNRSGGEEHWVVDNRDGSLTVRCETAINGDADIDGCDICERWMIGVDMQLHDNYKVCMRCTSKLNFTEIFTKVVDTACKCFLSFPSFEGDFPAHQRALCLDCDETHTLCPNYAAQFKDQAVLKESLNALIWRKDRHEIADALVEALIDEITEVFERLAKAKCDAKDLKRQRQAYLEDRCAVARKRLLLTTIPMLAKLTDEEFNTHVPAKFARLISEKEIEITERFCAATEMTTEDVITFTKFLIHGPDK